MAEYDYLSGSTGSRHLLGRRIIIVLPLIILTIVVLGLAMSLPTRYYFKACDGKIGLRESKVPVLWGMQSQVVQPFAANPANFKELLGKRFDSAEDALTALRECSMAKLEENHDKILDMEAEMIGPYTSYLGYLGGAQAAGVQGFEKEIAALETWLAHIKGREHREGFEAKPAMLPPPPPHGEGVGMAEHAPPPLPMKHPGEGCPFTGKPAPPVHPQMHHEHGEMPEAAVHH
mgnify:FL=1